MISVNEVGLSFGNIPLFKDVSIKFTPGNCYGVIGANGAGKSTFLRILSGDIQPDSGDVSISTGQRLAVLRQDQFAFDEHTVMHTVIMGHKHLYDIMMEREAVYAKEEFSEEDGLRASTLEGEFADLNGWEAEAEASTLLDGLGIDESLHDKKMSELEGGLKVRVLLAQALFGNPDILLLDEPTNNLDLESINWLEGFLEKFNNTVIVVSHDRHFLNRVCTHIADIDFQKISVYVGNYDFWYQASQLALKQSRDQQKRAEDKAKELKDFIQRFASNAAKSKQATSRKKMLDKLNLDNFKASSRRFPYVAFKPERECGRIVLNIENISKTIEDEKLLDNFSLTVNRGDKIAFVGREHASKSALFDIVSGEMEADSGTYEWGVTISQSYFPIESSRYFTEKISIIDWLKQYSDSTDESYVRGFLGRMLFSGDDALKNVQVLSGGEKVRCMLSKMMLSGANTLIMDDPTNHLDLEAITALNNALIEFPEVVMFTSHDHQFVHSIANRIVEITPGGIIDRMMPFDDYLEDAGVQALRDEYYHGHQRAAI
ncbi:ABC-F family ATP-binding cassette domain-containing protein [Spirochaeta dissipatitropha]